jgi:hypothetical protein
MTTAPQDAGGNFGLWEALIALGSFLINVGGVLIGGTWALSTSRQKVADKIDAAALELERKINMEMGVMKNKTSEMELWNRDNFVSKTTFSLAWTELRDSMRRFEDKLDKRLDSIDAKLSPSQRH